MSSSPPSLAKETPVQLGRAGRITLWVVQIALAATFLMAGTSKLIGAKAMVLLFDQLGFGQWFRYVQGLIETGAAIALLVPSFAVFGALALTATMAGATVVNIYLSESPVAPAILCLTAAAVVWTRRHELLRRR